MSEAKKVNMFQKLAAQQAAVAEPETPPPSPALPVPPTPPAIDPPKRATPVKGKRDNPDYCQASAYVPKKLRRSVDRVLLDLDGLDYSSLVEDLLRKWLKSKGVSE